jgi:hypothetical protein
MEGKQKTFLNAVLHETGERVRVMHDQKGSPFFVDINGKKYHIERLDLSEALPFAIPMAGESEQMKSLTDIMKTFDVKEQDDHRAMIAEREYWRKLRGDIFIAMLRRSDYHRSLLNDVDYIVDVLKEQDQKLFNILWQKNK